MEIRTKLKHIQKVLNKISLSKLFIDSGFHQVYKRCVYMYEDVCMCVCVGPDGAGVVVVRFLESASVLSLGDVIERHKL